MEITKQQAEQMDVWSNWTFRVNDVEITVRGMTENQARMFASEKTKTQIGDLVRVTDDRK
jgi:hypothetical protein